MRNTLAILIGLVSASVPRSLTGPTLKSVSAVDKEKGTIIFGETVIKNCARVEVRAEGAEWRHGRRSRDGV